MWRSLELTQLEIIYDAVRVRVVVCRLFVSYIKKWLQQWQFLETFGGEIIPTKKFVMDSYFGSNLQYF